MFCSIKHDGITAGRSRKSSDEAWKFTSLDLPVRAFICFALGGAIWVIEILDCQKHSFVRFGCEE